jgi:hypothetical protein
MSAAGEQGDATGEPPRAGGAAARRPWPLRVLKAVVLALLPLLLLLALTELLLWAFDLGDPEERLTLTRGFSEAARYLVEDPEVPGGWVTQMYDDDIPETAIPPKSTRLRVLMFGGSNTQGFPEEYVEQRLDAARPAPGFEVINLGRAGYGSERVRILMTQAMVLEPDLVFIYLGHNEFVEAGFAMELINAWRQPWLQRAVDKLSRLRTLNVLVSALSQPPAPPVAGAVPLPEARAQRGPDFGRLTYEKTLFFYDVYRKNYEAILATAEAAGARVMISTVVGNMLFPPVVVGTPPLQPAQLAYFRKVQREAVELLPLRFRAGLLQTGPGDPPVRLAPRDWGDSLTREQQDERRGRGYRPEPPALRPMPPPFDGGPFWTDPELWIPEVMELLPSIAAVHARELAPAVRADVERAIALLEEARALCTTDPLVLYELGLCHWLLGEDELACALLRESARYDRAPTRGNDVTNGIVRALAAAHPEVAFVDAEEQVRATCPGGLISYEVMMDNCHLHPAARAVLMDAFVPALLELSAR